MSNQMANDQSAQDIPRRWTRILDILEDGSLYTEEAERLWVTGITIPSDEEQRAEALYELAELVSDKVVFFAITDTRPNGILEVSLNVAGVNVADAMREKGF